MIPASSTLVFLVGPPAVGKMTVGHEISRLTGMPLFHNHLSIEAVLPVFPFGSPPFSRLVSLIRHETIREVAKSDLPGVIFTFVWAFDAVEEQGYVQGLVDLFEAEGGRVVYAELWADLETRLERNASPDRLEAKPSKRDLAASRARIIAADQRWRLSSDGDFPFGPHLRIDNSALSPSEAADRIVEYFGLPRVGVVEDEELPGGEERRGDSGA